MSFFITGTDTDIGKTVVASWICLHTNSAYWKPIQTGSCEGTDTNFIHSTMTNIKTYPEAYIFHPALSPHAAAAQTKNANVIDLAKISLSNKEDNLVVEGAGGVLVPLNSKDLMIDLIQKLQLPVLIVSRSSLGTINHTCLTIEALRTRNIRVIGVIMNNYDEQNSHHQSNQDAIEFYGKIKVLARLPQLKEISVNNLRAIELPSHLQNALKSTE